MREVKVPNRAAKTTTTWDVVGVAMPFVPEEHQARFARLIASGL
ncbi:hypothetical protein [Streptomyces sp. NPDC048057]